MAVYLFEICGLIVQKTFNYFRGRSYWLFWPGTCLLSGVSGIFSTQPWKEGALLKEIFLFSHYHYVKMKKDLVILNKYS